MTTIDRNPDVNTDTEKTPPGCYIHEGKNLMQSARFAKVPFGVASRRQPCGNSSRMETLGLVIRESDRARFRVALAKKAKRKLAEA